MDAIVTLGDLQPSWLESLDKCCQPKLGVYGNHDDEPYMTYFGIDDVHLNQIDLDSGVSVQRLRGLRVLPALRASAASGRPTRSEQAKKLIRKLPAADVLLCHCPPRGVNDDPDDPAHIGFEALREWVLKHRPRYLLHGHVHPPPGSCSTASATRTWSTSTAPRCSTSHRSGQPHTCQTSWHHVNPPGPVRLCGV